MYVVGKLQLAHVQGIFVVLIELSHEFPLDGVHSHLLKHYPYIGLSKTSLYTFIRV